MAKKPSLYDKADKKLQRWAATVSALLVIGGAVVGLGAWINEQVTGAISAQISSFQEEVRASDKENKQATTRLELMILIEHDPENVVAIEKMARYYFQDLDGDLYMTQKYSEWAKMYGGDTTIVIGGK